MDITNILNIQALDFDIWGIHVKANLMMSILIVLLICSCWVWNKHLEHKRNKQKQDFEEYKFNSENPTYCRIHRQYMRVESDTAEATNFTCPVDGCDRGFTKAKPQVRVHSNQYLKKN